MSIMSLLSSILVSNADVSKLKIHFHFSGRCCSILNWNWQAKIKEKIYVTKSFCAIFGTSKTPDLMCECSIVLEYIAGSGPLRKPIKTKRTFVLRSRFSSKWNNQMINYYRNLEKHLGRITEPLEKINSRSSGGATQKIIAPFAFYLNRIFRLNGKHLPVLSSWNASCAHQI